MTATGHALVATLIIAKIHNPYISFPLVFVSHFVCDIIPHWDTGTHHRNKTKKALFYESGFDVAISIVSSYFLYHNILGQNDYVLLYFAVFISQLPDWLTAPYFIMHWKSPIVAWSKYMYKVQHKLNSRLDKPWGIVTQVATVLILYILLFKVF